MRTGLSYGDVCMVPKYNNIKSRGIPNLATKLTTGIDMRTPIVAANMDTVIGPELAEVLVKKGSVPILHRFYKDYQELHDLITKLEGNCFLSVGVDDMSVLDNVIYDATHRVHGICVDIAHGHSEAMRDTLAYLTKEYPTHEIIAGNVCTERAFHDLVNWGATAVKVGIGPGEVCTTRKVTPFGVPQFSAIQACAKVARELKTPLIADGGIKSSRDITLALAAGASSVMIGGLFARTTEAAGGGNYRGQASAEFQVDYFGQVKTNTVPEGRATCVKLTKPAEDLIDELEAGVRSGMTYCGAINIEELQAKAEFMAITGKYENGA